MLTNKLTIVPVTGNPIKDESSSAIPQQNSPGLSYIIKTAGAEISFFNGVDGRITQIIMKEYNIILWSVMVEDWERKGGSKRIKEELLRKMNKEDIILLHDNDETIDADKGAPVNTVQALDEVLQAVI